MMMEQYLTNTDDSLWQVILNGDGPIQVTTDENGVETKKFLRALPSSWNNVALIMRNKDGIDDLDIDDLYNNLKVFEANIKGAILQGNVEHQEIKGRVLEMKDGLGYDWSYIAQDEPTEFALMSYTSNSSRSDTEANLEIVAYQLSLESVKAQSVVHQKNEVVYEKKIAVLEFEV
ncbi:hypothetical protein Tco_0280812 [Tanacetum coccineum]